MFKPVREKRQQLYENVVLQIKALILEGNLKPGDKLPAEREAAEIFGVSRSCIREATKSLATLGLVKIVHGQGVFVLEANADDSITHVISQIFVPGIGTIRDLFEMRNLIETQTAEWAARRRTKEEAEAILATVTNVQRLASSSSPNLITLWEHDTKFHTQIAHATHNQVLVRTMRGVLDLMAETRKSTLLVKDRPPKSVAEHLAVAEAIMAGDADLAREAMCRHLNNVENDLAYL